MGGGEELPGIGFLLFEGGGSSLALEAKDGGGAGWEDEAGGEVAGGSLRDVAGVLMEEDVEGREVQGGRDVAGAGDEQLIKRKGAADFEQDLFEVIARGVSAGD